MADTPTRALTDLDLASAASPAAHQPSAQSAHTSPAAAAPAAHAAASAADPAAPTAPAVHPLHWASASKAPARSVTTCLSRTLSRTPTICPNRLSWSPGGSTPPRLPPRAGRQQVNPRGHDIPARVFVGAPPLVLHPPLLQDEALARDGLPMRIRRKMRV